MNDASRTLRWPHCPNTRHLGGLPAALGARTRDHALVRAARVPHGALPDGYAGRVIDLRSSHERAQDPPHDDLGELRRHLPLVDERDPAVFGALRQARDAADLYRVLLDRCGPNIAAALAAIADAPDGAVVVHCTLGKDRTGLVVALTLRLLGVPDDDIARDYALSDHELRGATDALLARVTDPEERAALASKLTARPHDILAALDHLDARHGGAEAYLRAHGLTDAHVTRLRARLTHRPEDAPR